jgi:oxepin-CoA hydrolase/3-oxo-5,6-dehydrosuberyl-CoA semialdehyde dehydrogenase
MQFIQPDLETFLSHLNRLESTAQPQWGKMSAQRMVEHLTETVYMSMGNSEFGLLIPEEKIEKMQTILFSDVPMPKEFKVPFAPEEYTLRNEELELAVDEFVETWLNYEEYYEQNQGQLHLHPFYGDLNKEGWDRMHSKHFTHHFEQFGIL